MKISLQWLNDFIDVSDFVAKPQELASKLTDVGFEVEGISDRAAQFKNVVVGHIRERGQHPNADRLTLCQVDVGDGKLRQIVCGAKNHKAGDHVVVALPGAVLPGDFEIKLSKIRDVESQGMLCSQKELGLAAESEGILILSPESKVGATFASVMGFDDIVLDISVSPNRADVLSHFGMARELAVILGRGLKKIATVPQFSGTSAVKVSVQSQDLCPRYCGLTFKNVTVGPSPAWLKTRLESLDVNSVNNVVDITNFVMMELGQPLHAFDRKSLIGDQIQVGLAKAGEEFTSFDGTKFKLTGQELMIRDGKNPLVIAGVVGSPNSGISLSTTDVFLEGAYFIPETVRRTSRNLGIETDSAYRFSRGTDPEMIPQAMARAAELLKDLCGAEQLTGVFDYYPKPAIAHSIPLSVDYVSQRLGYTVTQDEFSMLLKRMGCKIESGRATVPLYRVDLKEDVDLVEEYGRLNGFNKIPEAFPALLQEPSLHEKNFTQDQKLRRCFAAEGFHQAINYGFLNPKTQHALLGDLNRLKALGIGVMGEAVALKNPLNEELSTMRLSLLPGIFRNVVNNIRYGVQSGRLFELGMVFGKLNSEYLESPRIALTIFGKSEGLWDARTHRPAVYDLKTAVENLMARLRIARVGFKPLTSDEAPEFLHPGQSAAIVVEGRAVGVIGTLHPKITESEKLGVEVSYAEVDVQSLMRGQPRLPKLKTPSQYPAVQRDLAFLVPTSINASEVEKIIAKVAGPLLQSVEVFDSFEGGNLPAGIRSLGFRMVYQDANATMNEEALQSLQTKIIDSVKQNLNIAMR